MSAATEVATPAVSGPLPLHDVEKEISRQMRAVQEPGEAPTLAAHLSNLLIYCDSDELAAKVESVIPAIVLEHPARVLLLVATPGPRSLTATVHVRPHPKNHGRRICSAQVTLRAQGEDIDRLPYAARALRIGDLPINLWWAVPQPPPLGGAVLYDLEDRAQQIIYDSIGWPEPARGVVTTASWLGQVEETSTKCSWRAAADLNWRRLKYWRRIMAQGLDPASAPSALEGVTDVLIEHGPHAVIQAWELVSWLATCLGWRVQAGRVQPGVEIGWQFVTQRSPVQVRIRRLDQGPSNIRTVRVEYSADQKPVALRFRAEHEYRLSVLPESGTAASRTLTVPEESLANLVARQLSDRERDLLFHASMAVAQKLAQSVLA
jgi:glucose-6-phosphate dehydrogenase assembly protein OpcA